MAKRNDTGKSIKFDAAYYSKVAERAKAENRPIIYVLRRAIDLYLRGKVSA